MDENPQPQNQQLERQPAAPTPTPPAYLPPQPEQPAPYPPATPQPTSGQSQSAPYPPVAPDNSSQTFGIIGLVLGFLFWPAGIVFSIISLVKANKTHASKTLGIVGLIINILAILSTIGIILLTFLAYSGVQTRNDAYKAHTAANYVSNKAEAYSAMENKYPATLADFDKYPESKLDPATATVTSATPTDNTTVSYKRCSDASAQVTYFDTSEHQPVIIPLGNADPLKAC